MSNLLSKLVMICDVSANGFFCNQGAATCCLSGPNVAFHLVRLGMHCAWCWSPNQSSFDVAYKPNMLHIVQASFSNRVHRYFPCQAVGPLAETDKVTVSLTRDWAWVQNHPKRRIILKTNLVTDAMWLFLSTTRFSSCSLHQGAPGSALQRAKRHCAQCQSSWSSKFIM